MSREKLRSKYGMSAHQKAVKQEEPWIESWRDSAAVVRLSEFIRENRHHGIHMIIKYGRPVLHFNPGLRRGNQERWDIAMRAEILFHEAVDDLMKLIERKKIELPERVQGGNIETPVESRTEQPALFGAHND